MRYTKLEDSKNHIRSLRHVRPLTNRKMRVNLACSTVASILVYRNSVLYGVTDTNTAKLQRVQNSLARTVCKSPYNTHVTELLSKLHWLLV
jgi:hypothetical protein